MIFIAEYLGIMPRLIYGGMLGIFLVGLLACSHTSEKYFEKHEISNLTVVFLDEFSLQERWKERTGKNAIRFSASPLSESLPSVKTVRGFFDFRTNTLYCPKWNYEVCGHELHHAAIGHFHPNH